MLTYIVDLVNAPAADRSELTDRWSALEMPIPTPVKRSDVGEIGAFLDEFAAVFDAESEDQRVEHLNHLMSRHVSPGRITNHDDSEWHVHHSAPGAGFAAIVAAESTAAAVSFLTDRGMQRVGRCAADRCDRAFVDFSAPGRQRFCSPACSNRSAVSRFRERRKTIGEGSRQS